MAEKNPESEPAEVLASRRAFSGRVVRVDVEEVRLPGGKRAELEVIRHSGAAAVVPLVAAGEVLLIRQYRHAIGGRLLELPAGKLDPGETPEECARRELEEETGWRAGRLTALGWIWTTPGFTDEKIWLYLAEDLQPSRQNLQGDEELTLERMGFAQAVELAADGGLEDAKSICGLLRAAAHLRDRG